jgi:oligopeptide transport system substrate-binding protein
MTNRLTSILTAVLALAAAATSAAAGQEVRLPLDARVGSLDPAKLVESHEFAIAENLFEGLTAIAADGRIVPGVAARWETSADGRIWTFHLRPDARWSNGESVTAEDFVYSLRREVSPSTASPSAAALEPIEGATEITSGAVGDPCMLGVRALDRHVLQITLRRPTPWLLLLLSHYAALPTPKAAVEAFGDHWAEPGHMVSNGPYVLADWTADGDVTLVRNRFFHAAAAVQVETVRFVRSHGRAGLRQFEAGEYDVVSLTGPELAEAEARYPRQLIRQSELATAYLAINRTRGALGDERIRRALSMVIDREALITEVDQSRHTPAYELVAPAISRIADYRPQSAGWAHEPMAARIAAAQALLNEARAGASAPLTVRLAFMDSPRNQRLMAAIAAMWKTALGVETQLQPADQQAHMARLTAHDFELAAVTWDPDFADPLNYLGGFRSYSDPANFGAYAEPAFNALIDRSRDTADPAARMRLLEAAERRLIDSEGVIPLRHGDLMLLVNPRLQGYVADPLARHPARYLRLESPK